MSNNRELADLISQAGGTSEGVLAGRRNLIINGAMQVWQRGTSGFTVSGSYSADRWWMANATSIDRSTDAPDGFTYSFKITAGGSNCSFGQAIEIVTGSASPLVSGGTVTLSFYAKTVSGTDQIAAALNFRDSKFSATNQSTFSGTELLDITTTWQRVTTTFTVPAVNASNTIIGLEIYGIDTDVHITGVQLELGSVATPFEHRSYGEELALCQRYYQLNPTLNCFMNEGNTYANFPAGKGWRVPMRAIGTLGIFDNSNLFHRPGIAFYTGSNPLSGDYGSLTPSTLIGAEKPIQILEGKIFLDAEL